MTDEPQRTSAGRLTRLRPTLAIERFRDRPLEKLWGGGGGEVGNFLVTGIFFVTKFLF